MKRIMVVVLAVIMLGLAAPMQSEANDAWVPAAIIGSIIIGAAIADAAHTHHVYVYDAPRPVYVYRSPRPAYVYRRDVKRSYDYRHGHPGQRNHRGDRGHSLPPQHQPVRSHR